MTTLIWLAASSLIWGAVLYGAVFALQSRCELSGNVRQWMWRGAAMLLILPWLAAPFVDALAPGVTLNLAPMVEAIAEPVAGASMDAIATSMTIEPTGVEPVVRERSGLDLPWIEILFGALAAGWLVRIGLARLAGARMRRLLESSSPSPEGVSRDALESWSRRLSLRRKPDLRTIAADVSPFSSGALRPVICLPDGIDRKVRKEALGLIVGHECIHVARGDGWWRPVERAVADLLWFNPFAWAIRRELDLARELACDEAVVAASDARRAYARTLRDVAGMVAGISSSAPAASMSLSGGSRLLAMRMKRTLASGRSSGWLAIVGAIMLAFAAAPVAVAQAVLIEAVQAPAVPAVPEAVAAPVAPVVVPAPVPAPEPPAVPAPAPVPVAPPVPAAPAAPEIVTVGPGETLHIWFPARVVQVEDRTGQNRGFDVKLVQTEPTDAAQGCTAAISGLSSLSVASGQTIPRGAPVGVMGEDSPIAISCQSIKVAASAPTPSVIVASRIGVDPATRTVGVRPGGGRVIVIPAQQNTPEAVRPRNDSLKLEGASRAVLETDARKTMGFGYVTTAEGKNAFHEGIDLAARVGTLVYSPAQATVTFAGAKGSYGNVVELSFDGSHTIRFAHLDEIRVKAGDSFPAGHLIGAVGDDEFTTGPHLHLEYRYEGRSYDPEKVEGLILTRPG